MYQATGHIHVPTSLFTMIGGDDRRFIMRKAFADAARDVREPLSVGERMSTHDGAGARVHGLSIALTPAKDPTELGDYAAVRAAVLGNAAMVGVTTYRLPGGEEVALTYPVKICNVAHSAEKWQIDTGPILLPDHWRHAAVDETALTTAYIVYNAWTQAELAVLDATPVGGDGATSHYSCLETLDGISNRLYRIT
jgi:hypothetical protein